MPATESPTRLYHLALRDEWADAVRTGSYRRSTLGKSLEDEGFIHCSYASQVQLIADLVYRGRTDVVLLSIDADRLGVEVRVERAPGSAHAFPHIYGPLPVAAVDEVRAVPTEPDGRLAVEGLLAD